MLKTGWINEKVDTETDRVEDTETDIIEDAEHIFQEIQKQILLKI